MSWKKDLQRDAGESVFNETLSSLGIDEDIVDYAKEVVTSILDELEGKSEQELEEELTEAIHDILVDGGAEEGAVKELCNKVAHAVFSGGQDTFKGDENINDANGNTKTEEYVCKVEDLMLMYGGGKQLLKNTTLELRRNHIYGILGANGAGKSTLLNQLQSGGIKQVSPDDYNIISVDHEVVTDPTQKDTQTVFDFCKKEATRKHNITNADEIEEKVTNVLLTVGYVRPGQEAENKLSWDKTLSELSGGWRMRVSLAGALMGKDKTDILLLDEPTNHLDVNAVKVLTELLVANFEKASIVIVSHDPNFLDNTVTDIIHFESAKLTYYPGNFSNFVKEMCLTEDMKKEVLNCDASELGEVLLSVKKARDGNNASTSADGEWMGCTPVEGVDKLQFPIPGKLDGISNDKKAILELKNASFSYPTDDDSVTPELVLDNVSCKLTLGSRVGVVGRNGAGKSTLMNLIAGEMNPNEDDKNDAPLFKHRNMRMSFIAQHHAFHLQEYQDCPPLIYMQKRYKHGYDEELQERLFHLEPEEEAYVEKMAKKHGKYGRRVKDLCGRQKRGKEIWYEVQWTGLEDSKMNTFEPLKKLRMMGVEKLCKAYDERFQSIQTGNDQRPLTDREIVKHFSNFNFDEDMVKNRTIGGFSMGQKSRLTLAAALWVKPHCIMMDEPTNYLDQETLDALAKALKFFRGAVCVISHKQDFLDKICNEEWLVKDKKVNSSKKAAK